MKWMVVIVEEDYVWEEMEAGGGKCACAGWMRRKKGPAGERQIIAGE
jgi:hypothetical protein